MPGAPHSPLVLLFVITAVAIAALGGFGWTLLEQERHVEVQRARDRLEHAADAVVARAKAALARVGEDVGVIASGSTSLIAVDGATSVLFDGSSIDVTPANRLLFLPVTAPKVAPLPGAVAEAEALELAADGANKAARIYRRLTESHDPTVRAYAFLHLARYLQRSGDTTSAVRAFRELGSIHGVRLDAGPADLVGREAAARLSGDTAAAAAIQRDLLAPRWALSRGEFELYWTLAAAGAAPPRDRFIESVALLQLWTEWKGSGPILPQGTHWIDGAPLLVIQRRSNDRVAAALFSPNRLLAHACGSARVQCELTDHGAHVAGERVQADALRSRRPADETGLPVTIAVAGSVSADGLGRRRMLLAAQMVGTMALLVAGAYFIGRAIRRDAETARLQREFVAAVSHEFRSPLTSIRQLSEMLALGRAPVDSRRQGYYELLVSETSRLQRLVETLLDYGRLEAGARAYRKCDIDVRELVESVSREFTQVLAQTGRTIDVSDRAPTCQVRADPDALALALRNLIDNALKYSPADSSVRIDWSAAGERVCIRVHDRGIGIAPSEHESIFRRFVRGRAAVAANIKGTGLGLAIVRHIAVSHGGAVTVESEVGRGSTFAIVLPAARQT